MCKLGVILGHWDRVWPETEGQDEGSGKLSYSHSWPCELIPLVSKLCKQDGRLNSHKVSLTHKTLNQDSELDCVNP